MTKTKPFDFSEHIDTPEDAAEYLQIMLDENGTDGFYAALGHIAKSKSMSKIAVQANVGRESLYKSLSNNGNPQFVTIKKVLDTLGIEIKFKAA